MKIAIRVAILLLTVCVHSTWSSQSDDLLTLTTKKKPIAVAVTPKTHVVKQEIPTTSKVVASVSPSSATKGVVRKLDYDDEVLDGLAALFSQMTIQGDYLGLGRVNPSKEKYVISMCPINSSGDIYHILAYVILSLAQCKDIPPIMLTYDGTNTPQRLESEMNTYSQVERSFKFCEFLGYKQHFGVLRIETEKCQRQNNRQSKLVDGLAAEDYTHYVDQKALTTIIARYFRQNGRAAVATLKHGFEQCDLTNQDLPKVKQAALAEVEKIKRHKGTQPLVMMHMRYSSNANETQNPLVNLTSMKSFLEDNGRRKVWFVFADGRSSRSFTEITDHRTNVFPYPHPTKKYAGPNPANLDDAVDYGKFYHLQILLGLLPLSNVRFIGNTSGTLDLAAFVGHQVYNMHALAESINYQTARILIQSAFLAVECLPCSIIKVPVESKKDPGKTRDQIVLSGDYNPIHLSTWLESGTKPVNSHVGNYRHYRKNNGYKELFYVQALQDDGKDVEVVE